MQSWNSGFKNKKTSYKFREICKFLAICSIAQRHRTGLCELSTLSTPEHSGYTHNSSPHGGQPSPIILIQIFKISFVEKQF